MAQPGSSLAHTHPSRMASRGSNCSAEGLGAGVHAGAAAVAEQPAEAAATVAAVAVAPAAVGVAAAAVVHSPLDTADSARRSLAVPEVRWVFAAAAAVAVAAARGCTSVVMQTAAVVKYGYMCAGWV